MLTELKPFVPSAVCLACDGCCRFRDPASPWRPRISAPERERIAAQAPLEDEPGAAGCSVLKTCPDGESFVCQFFNSADHICRVYPARPFECRLYPFVLNRNGARLELCAHLNCPFVQEQLGRPLYQEYTAYLKEFFASPSVRDHLRAYPGLAADYSEFSLELLTLFDIPL